MSGQGPASLIYISMAFYGSNILWSTGNVGYEFKFSKANFQALDRGAWQLGVDLVATGHNADDVAETVLMNMLRGDVGRLSRCTGTSTTIGVI